MGRIFERHGETVRADLTANEVELLLMLRDELERALEDGGDDPAVHRLFPPAVLGDADADRDVRALLREDLLSNRLDGLQELLAIIERGTPHRRGLRLELVEDEPVLVLGVLNDLRLALGAWVDVEALDLGTVVDDETLARLAVMDHLAAFQEELLAIVDPVSLTHYDERDARHDGP